MFIFVYTVILSFQICAAGVKRSIGGGPSVSVSPIGAAAVVRPFLPFDGSPVQASWTSWGASRPDFGVLRIPSVPPIVNPVLARRTLPAPFPRAPNPGVPNLVWFDPRVGPPPNAVPLVPPASEQQISGLSTQNPLFDSFVRPQPLPSSYLDLRPSEAFIQEIVGGSWSVNAEPTVNPQLVVEPRRRAAGRPISLLQPSPSTVALTRPSQNIGPPASIDLTSLLVSSGVNDGGILGITQSSALPPPSTWSDGIGPSTAPINFRARVQIT